MFLINKRTLAAELESPAYTAATLASADFNVRIKEDITYSPEIMEYRRRVMQGDLDFDSSVMGRQKGTISFTVDLAPAAAVNTEPAWSKLLKACGLKAIGWNSGSEVAVGSAVEGISWEPHSDMTHTPITFEIEEIAEGASASRLITRFGGAMGNVKFGVNTVGEPVQMKFEFSGALLSMADRVYASRLQPTSLSTVVPPALLSATALISAVAQDCDKFEFDMGGDVQEWVDPSLSTGVKGFYIAGREGPMMTIDPTSKLLASEPVYTQWLAGTLVPVNIAMGGSVPLTFSATKGQHTVVSVGERNGAATFEKTYLLTRGATANKTFQLLQGATT